MTDTPPLGDFTTPIVSGLTDAPDGAGRLNPERAADLDERLRGLAHARAEAGVGARNYVVSGAEEGPIDRFLMDGLGNIPIRFWICPGEGHSDSREGPDGWPVETVHWEGDVARCTYEGCGRTSADKRSDT
jgi:hypothetical protein